MLLGSFGNCWTDELATSERIRGIKGRCVARLVLFCFLLPFAKVSGGVVHAMMWIADGVVQAMPMLSAGVRVYACPRMKPTTARKRYCKGIGMKKL